MINLYSKGATNGLGLREGEVLGLYLEDINGARHTIHICHAILYLMHQGRIISKPKTEKAKRPIQVPDFVYAALKDHCAKQLRERNQWNVCPGHKSLAGIAKMEQCERPD